MILDMARLGEHTRLVPLEDYFSAVEAAEQLGIKKISVLKLIEREKLKAEKHGNMYFIHKSEVARYKQERQQSGRPKKKRSYNRKLGD
jgi:excisionase family DNA binding protein